MNDLLKSKTVWASVALLVLSGVRVTMGDVSAIAGVQEGIMALVPIFLRIAIEKNGGAAAQAKDAPAAQAPDAPAARDQGGAWPAGGGG